MEALLPLYNILKSQLQTIENQRVPLNSVETEFSQMFDIYYALAYNSFSDEVKQTVTCSFLSKIFLLILTGSIASKGICIAIPGLLNATMAAMGTVWVHGPHINRLYVPVGIVIDMNADVDALLRGLKGILGSTNTHWPLICPISMAKRCNVWIIDSPCLLPVRKKQH